MLREIKEENVKIFFFKKGEGSVQVVILLYIIFIATYSLVENSNTTQSAFALGPNCLLKCICQILIGCKLE